MLKKRTKEKMENCYSIVFGKRSYEYLLTNLSLQEKDLIERVLRDCECRYKVFEYDESI